MSDRISEFAREIIRDLRDRNMLIPAIALVVAIIAVPVLLGGGGSEVTAPVAPSAGATPASMTGSAEVDPVVLAEVPGLRNYRERLDEFGARNPFKQQMTGGSGTDEATGTGGGSGGSGSGSTSTTTDTISTSTSTSGSVTTDTSSTTTTDTGGTGSGGGSGGSGGETKVFQIQIDVRVGRPGEAKVLTDVQSLDFLPGDERPIVQYVEGDYAATKAAFVVSPAVISTEGDGNCDPGRNNCQFLLMKKGDVQFFDYGPEANVKTYKLELLAIRRVEVDPKDLKGLGRDAVKASNATAQFVAQMTG
jgi:hypothetical protein